MLIEDLNKMCKGFVSSLADTFRNNQNLQMAKLYVSNLPSKSKKPLEFITEYLVDHAALIESKDVKIFEQKKLIEHVEKWNVKTMYEKLPMSDKETFWEDLDEIVKKVKIILCAGSQLDKFESVAQDIVKKTGIRDLPPEEKTIQNVLSKVMTSFLEDPSVASNVGSLMQGLDGEAQERVLKLTGMDHLLPKIQQLQDAQSKSAVTEEDNSAQNDDYFAQKDQKLNQEFSSQPSATPPSSPTTSTTTSNTTTSSSPTTSTTTISPPTDSSSPFDFSNMNKQMFMQLAAQLKKSGELDEVLEEVKSNPDSLDVSPPSFPGMPANMDIKKIIESLTKENGLLSTFGKNIPKPRRR